MNFEKALTALKAGKKITRDDPMWEGYFLVIVQDEGESIQLFDSDGWVDCNHCVSNPELLYEDWEVVK